MTRSTYQVIPFFVRRAGDEPNEWPGGFLNEDDISICLCFQNSISKQFIFSYILRKNIKISYNHTYVFLIAKQIDLALLFLIF